MPRRHTSPSHAVTFSTRLPTSLAPNRLTRVLETRRADGQPVLDLTESNPSRVGLQADAGWLGLLATPHALRYEPAPLGLRDARMAVAADFARRGHLVSPDRLLLTTSTSEAYGFIFKLLCNPDDEVLVPRPSYPLFDYLTALECVRAVDYHLAPDALWAVDWPQLEGRLTSKTRAILVVSPNNPTGSRLTADDGVRLMELCGARGLALVFDEVFAEYPIDPRGTAFGPPTAQQEVLAFTLGGLSKTVGLPQLKLAWTALGGPDPLVDAARARLEVIADTVLGVATPVQLALSALLERGASLRARIQERVRGNYRQLEHAVRQAPRCTLLRAEAGWSAVLRVPATRPEEDLAIELLAQRGLLVHPGHFFDFPHEAFLVVSLLPEPEVFREAVSRLLAHLEDEAARPADAAP